MSHALNLFPRAWRAIDRMARFPRRTPNFSRVSKVDELMAQRFEGLAVCASCALKYRDAIRRWGYYRHPDITFTNNACDFCERVFASLPLWPKEERHYSTQQEYFDRSLRAGIRGAPHAYDHRRRVSA